MLRTKRQGVIEWDSCWKRRMVRIGRPAVFISAHQRSSVVNLTVRVVIGEDQSFNCALQDHRSGANANSLRW